MRILKSLGLAILASIAMSACATLPRSAPTVGEVTGGVANGISGEQISIVDIDLATISGQSALAKPLSVWAISDGPMIGQGVQPGDKIEITIFEVGYALFAQGRIGENGANTGGAYKMGPLLVPDDGTIGLPFAGRLRVAGLSPAQIGRAYENRLSGQSQNAQVLVTAEAGPRRSVIVSGDLEEPGRIALTQDTERLLDAIALAGGPSSRPADTLVNLSRAGQTSTARLQHIIGTASENVVLAPGDRIELTRDIRSITVLGAASKVSEVQFDGQELTLAQALARAGGADKDRADPTGLFIFRQIPTDIEGDAGAGSEVQPVIYRLNLLEPESYFAAQNFAMRRGDIMLMADAKSNEIEAFLQLINTLAAPIVTVDFLTR